jgi:hypothetical protein
MLCNTPPPPPRCLLAWHTHVLPLKKQAGAVQVMRLVGRPRQQRSPEGGPGGGDRGRRSRELHTSVSTGSPGCLSSAALRGGYLIQVMQLLVLLGAMPVASSPCVPDVSSGM